MTLTSRCSDGSSRRRPSSRRRERGRTWFGRGSPSKSVCIQRRSFIPQSSSWSLRTRWPRLRRPWGLGRGWTLSRGGIFLLPKKKKLPGCFGKLEETTPSPITSLLWGWIQSITPMGEPSEYPFLGDEEVQLSFLPEAGG